MTVSIRNADVLDVAADALIYSTNVLFNCSGGVGACLVTRYGQHVQKDLHAILQRRGVRFAERGEVEEFVSAGLPYQAVFHTVPSDGFYETSEEIVAGVLRKALEGCVARPEVRTVVFSALATGYGRLEFADFLRIASELGSEEAFSSLDRITLAIADPHAFSLAREQTEKEGLKFVFEETGRASIAASSPMG
ncbi:MAG: putative phosphatase, C-terminal domain of histone macroH2A1-like protein [Akkermansiaceae bacterium]|nr:putative phosphatase, C-terminal domain of histone macroH2A1-like protein [Akkermansiaceae bacterium]